MQNIYNTEALSSNAASLHVSLCSIITSMFIPKDDNRVDGFVIIRDPFGDKLWSQFPKI